MDGGDDPECHLSYTLKMVYMVNFVLCVFYQGKSCCVPSRRSSPVSYPTWPQLSTVLRAGARELMKSFSPALLVSLTVNRKNGTWH